MYPDAPFIPRQGEINAWDHPDFRKAIEATGRKQMIVAGIATDVCKYLTCHFSVNKGQELTLLCRYRVPSALS